MTHPMAIFRSKTFVGLTCIALVVLWDWLFYHRPLGWSAALFAAVLTLVLVIRAPGLWRSSLGQIAMLLTGGLLRALVEEPSPLAVLMVIIAIGTLTLIAQRDIRGYHQRVSSWLGRWGLLLLTLPVRWILDSRIIARWLARHPALGRRLFAVMTFIAWWVLPVLAGMVFIVLFAIANPIIEKWITDAFNELWKLLDWLAFLSAGRILLWLVVFMGGYGLLRYRRRRRRALRRVVARPPVARVAGPAQWWAALTGPGMIIRCLLVFNGIFAVQSLLDITYLYGGAALPRGMTYAQYAHRGAYPLIATALLAGLFALISFRTGGLAHRSLWARRLVYLWIAQNAFLLFSTIWRLALYVDVYSLTRLRVATMIWVLLVALGFAWIILRIATARSNTWLWRMNVLTLLAVLYVCAFVNFDGIIAGFNVRHCREVTARGVVLDVDYLRGLGPDALPALHWIKAHLAARQEPVTETSPINQAIVGLQEELHGQLSDWRGWTYRRQRASQVSASPDGSRLVRASG